MDFQLLPMNFIETIKRVVKHLIVFVGSFSTKYNCNFEFVSCGRFTLLSVIFEKKQCVLSNSLDYNHLLDLPIRILKKVQHTYFTKNYELSHFIELQNELNTKGAVDNSISYKYK